VIVLVSDHYLYGLSSGEGYYLPELYGYNPQNMIERDHNRLIIWCGILEDMDPIVVDTPTFSLDILPTLSNLFGTEFDSRLMAGRDVFSDAPALVYNMLYDWKTEYGTYISSTNTFTPVSADLVIPEGYVEQVKAMVRNRIRFSSAVLEVNYMEFLFGQD
jgi:lipoteichoic acid synthase